LEAAKAGRRPTGAFDARPCRRDPVVLKVVRKHLFSQGGVPQDYAAAASWSRKAAEQGYAEAQYNLGVMYLNGLGVRQDYATAMSWYRKAAEQGHASAQYSLGGMYLNGHGVPRDYTAAHMWFNLAAASGFPDAEKTRDSVAARVTPWQIADAQKLAREWKPKSTPAPAEPPKPEPPREEKQATAPQQARTPQVSVARWQTQVAAHIERFKRYPAEARSRGEQGVAKVAFKIDHEGHLLGSRIVQSSGSAALDRGNAGHAGARPADAAAARSDFRCRTELCCSGALQLQVTPHAAIHVLVQIERRQVCLGGVLCAGLPVRAHIWPSSPR
jgi:hypothetical protein